MKLIPSSVFIKYLYIRVLKPKNIKKNPKLSSELNLIRTTRKVFWLFCLLSFFGCKKDNLKEKQIEQPGVKLPKVITYPYKDLTRYSVNITGAVTDSTASKIIESGFVVDRKRSNGSEKLK